MREVLRCVGEGRIAEVEDPASDGTDGRRRMTDDKGRERKINFLYLAVAFLGRSG